MSTPVKVLAAAAFVVLCALGAAQLLQRTRPRPTEPPPAETAARIRPEASATEAELAPPARDYAGIAQRDLFRPLVVAPKTAEGGGGEAAATTGAPGAAPTAKPAPGKAGGPPGPGGPTDPLADLALTGVVQVGDRLQVLIERLSTRTGRYVALNEVYDGFTVVLIGESSAVLQRGGKEYTLRMGGKQLDEPAQAHAASAPSAPTAPAPPPTGGGPGGFGMSMSGGMGAFGGDVLSWAESQSLEDLERMYGQYGQYLAPQDRARAEAYLQQRRARGR